MHRVAAVTKFHRFHHAFIKEKWPLIQCPDGSTGLLTKCESWKPWSVSQVSFVLKYFVSYLESQSVIYADQRIVNDPAPCINSQQSAGCTVCQVLTPTLQLCRCPWAPVNLHRMTFCCNANKRSRCFQSISLWKALEVSTGILWEVPEIIVLTQQVWCWSLRLPLNYICVCLKDPAELINI